MQAAQLMTPKERWLAAIHMEPVDRLPFWPKLDAAYPRAQAGPFGNMELSAIHDWIGSDKHVGIPGCVREVRKRTSVETTAHGKTRRQVYRTPFGEAELITQFDEPSQAWHPVQHPVQDLESIERMTAFFEDTHVELDPDALQQSQERVEQLGVDALTHSSIGKSPLMDWVEFLAGIEMAHYLLNDYQEQVERLFEAMHQVLVQKARILAEHSPVDVLYMVENTSTTLISPEQYRRYCSGHISEYGRICVRYGRPLFLHMCGHLKLLLDDLANLPAQAFEAFTSPTLGNTTLLEGRTACPDKCLVGGTNAILWTQPAGEIIAQIEKDLDALPHHRGIVVTSAGVMPPLCKPETIKTVCEWVQAYPATM